jgi:hypothetical protein
MPTHLEEFKRNFRGAKCVQTDEGLVYNYLLYSAAAKQSVEANFLIDRLNLDLEVIHVPNAMHFLVRPKI